MIKPGFALLTLILLSIGVNAQVVKALEDWRIYQGVIYDNSIYLPQGDSALVTTARYLYMPSRLPVPASQQPVVVRVGRTAVVRWSRTDGLPAAGLVEIYAGSILRYTANVFTGRTPAFAINTRLPNQLSAFANDADFVTNLKVNERLAGKLDTASASAWYVRKRPGLDLFNGSYLSLTDRPILFNGSYLSLTDRPNLFNGSYLSLTDRPNLFNGSYLSLTDRPNLFNGSYLSLTDRPNLFNGSYLSLTDRPLIPVVPGWVTSTEPPYLKTGAGGSVTSLNIQPVNADGSQLRVGALEIQGYDANQSYLGHNAYVDEGGIRRRSVGAAGIWMFIGNEGQFRFTNSGFGYSTPLATRTQMKMDAYGNWGVGAIMPIEAGQYDGSSIRVVGATGHVLLNTQVDVPSAQLVGNSTTLGWLPPRLTTNQRNAILTPERGLFIFNTDQGTINVYNGTDWKTLTIN